MNKAERSSTRVFLVEGHHLVRKAVANFLASANDLEVVGVAGTTAQAVSGIRSTSPDVVVMDVQLPDGDGIDLCRRLRTGDPDIRCVILTAHETADVIDRARLAGAAGVVTKNIRDFALLDAIRAAAKPRLPMTSDERDATAT